MLKHFKDPYAGFQTITLRLNDRIDLLSAGLPLTLADQIQVVNGYAGHDAQYVVIGMQERWAAADGNYDLTLILKPFSLERYWLWDTSVWDGGDTWTF
jgi:hypothetical protein